MERLIASKILKKNLNTAVTDPSDLNIIFTETNELFINKIDGSLIKISDIKILNYEDMIKIPDPDENIIYICKDIKSMYIWNLGEFVVISGGSLEEIERIKKELESLTLSYNEYAENTNISINGIASTLDTTSKQLAKLEEDVANSFTNITVLIETLTLGLTECKNSISDIELLYEQVTTDINSINSSISVIDKTIITIQEYIDSINQSIEQLELDISETNANVSKLAGRLDTKMYNTEFVINEGLFETELLDTVDLSSMVFEPNQSLEVIDITMKTVKPHTAKISIQVFHRIVDNTGKITNNFITDLSLEANQMINSIPISGNHYIDGYLVIKITNSGNGHDNLRIIAKIKRSVTT